MHARPDVLVLDLEPLQFRLLAWFLSDMGWETSSTTTVVEASGILADHHFDAVVVNSLGTQEDREEAVHRLHETEPGAFVVAYARRGAAAPTGADLLIKAPTSVDDVIEPLRSHLRESDLAAE